ncbi:hypothetical protein GMO_25980 [Gluconobacter morbifer G707]|uniref:Uncharacterized protein n=1 Tax=Gluconobacter morbifer G707 TaxID=1088869 RepID=G6XM80_9PROT|nr:hypothetical protein GMO_25980 [Gluconobacter morbifer G707]
MMQRRLGIPYDLQSLTAAFIKYHSGFRESDAASGPVQQLDSQPGFKS